MTLPTIQKDAAYFNDVALMNGLLDKALLAGPGKEEEELHQEYFYKGWGPNCQRRIADLLGKIDDLHDLTEESQALVRAFSRGLHRSADFAHAYAEAEGSGAVDGFISQYILQYLEGLSTDPDDFLILPAGCRTHAMLMAIRKQDDDHFELCLYNPGFFQEFGDHQNHPSSPDKSHAFMWYRDIPSHNIETLKPWRDFLRTRGQYETPPIYEAVKGLAEGGTFHRPSKQEDPFGCYYATRQRRESCTYTAIYALLRHQILKQAGRSKPERLMEWRLLKSKLVEVFASNFKGKNPAIRALVHRKVERMRAEGELMAFCRTQGCFERAMVALGAEPEEVPVEESALGRLVHLRGQAFILMRQYLESGTVSEDWQGHAVLATMKRMHDYVFHELEMIVEACCMGTYEHEDREPPYVWSKYGYMVERMV